MEIGIVVVSLCFVHPPFEHHPRLVGHLDIPDIYIFIYMGKEKGFLDR
jgi:hypothetical protein